MLSARYQREIFEKIFSIEKRAKLLLAIEGSYFPEVFAGKIPDGDGFVEHLVVAAEMFGERVCYHLIHIDTNALHERTPKSVQDRRLRMR